MTEAEQKQISEIEEGIKSIVEATPEKLAKTADLGKEMDFSGGIPYFVKIRALFEKLQSINMTDLPQTARAQLHGQIRNAKHVLTRIATFSPAAHQNPVTVRDQFISELPENYDGYWNVLTPIIAFNALLTGTDADLKQRQAEEIKALESLKQELSRKIENAQKEMEGLLSTARNTAAQLGITEYSKVFLAEATEHKDQATKWLVASVIGSLALCGWGLVTFWLHPNDGNNFFSVMQNAVSKGIILIGLLYFTITASKNYNAHRHNAILNKHRQNALQTFESFVKAAGDDPQTKNAVLLQATATIFSNQNTGYLAAGPESEGASKIIEIIKGVAPGKPS